MKKTVYFILGIFLVLWAAENILGLMTHKKPLVERTIRLRELPANLDLEEAVSSGVLEYSDGLRKKKVRFRTDWSGFVEPSIRYADPDWTVVFLGGSTTECRLVDEENRFPFVVGKILEEKTGLKINSLNSGTSGNHSMHSNDILLNKIIPFGPKAAVFHHNINDVVTLLLEGSYWNENPRRSLIVRSKGPVFTQVLKFMRYSLFRNIFDVVLSWPSSEIFAKRARFRNFDEFARLRGRKAQFDKQKMLNEFRMSLETFIGICRAAGIKPVLMTEASRMKENPDPVISKHLEILKNDYGVDPGDFMDLFASFNEMIREAGRKNRAPVIDLEKAVPKEGRYLYDIVHYTDEGSRFAAAEIARTLLDVLS